MGSNSFSTSNSKKEAVLGAMDRKIADNPTYANKIKRLNIIRRYDQEERDERHKQEVIELAKEYNIPPKERATFDELVILIEFVLETGDSGTKVIRRYAEIAGKSVKWINEIAKPKAGNRFKKALDEHTNNTVILSMKENKVYIERDILNNTVTGALTKLSKQAKVSKIIDDLKSEVAMLKNNIAAKESGEDWREEAQRLRDSGLSLSEIGLLLGKAKTTVGKYTIS